LIAARRTETTIRALPDPAELQQYREMDPELYEMLKREFAANGEHRREMQRNEAADRKTLVRAVTRNDTLGMVFSFSFAAGSLALAGWFVYIGKPTAALIGVLGLVPAIVGAFRVRRTPTEPTK
jgi:hypothetical protein